MAEDLSIVGDKSEEDGGLWETTIIKTKPTPQRNLSSCTEERNEEKGPAALAQRGPSRGQKLKGANTGEDEEERLNDDKDEINAEEFFKKKTKKRSVRKPISTGEGRMKIQWRRRRGARRAGQMTEKQQQKKNNKKKVHRDKNLASPEELQRDEDLHANRGKVDDDDEKDDDENRASTTKPTKRTLRRRKNWKKSVYSKKLLSS